VNAKFFDQIEKLLPSARVPEGFNSWMDLDREDDEEPDSSRNKRNGLGEPLLYVTVEQLVRLASHEGVTSTPHNKATWAYLAQISPKTKVALYWN
jgi:hypothetical protein